MNWPDGVVGYHVSLTPIRSWDRAPVWSFLFFFFLSFFLMRLVMFAKISSCVFEAEFSWCWFGLLLGLVSYAACLVTPYERTEAN